MTDARSQRELQPPGSLSRRESHGSGGPSRIRVGLVNNASPQAARDTTQRPLLPPPHDGGGDCGTVISASAPRNKAAS